MFGTGVALYLFCAGAGAGLYLVAYVLAALYLPRERRPRDMELLFQKIQIVVPATVACAALFLLNDLGRPDQLVLAFRNLGTSMLSLGASLLVLFFVALCAQVALRWSAVGSLRTVSGIVGFVAALLAAGVIVYTGLFLMQLRAVPFWGTPLVVALFVVSSLSSGLALFGLLGMMSLRRAKLPGPLVAALRADCVLLALELVLIACFGAVSLTGEPSAAESFTRLLRGDLAWEFWCMVLLGVAAPLFAGIRRRNTMSAVLLAESLCVLAGALLLRHCVLEAALRSFAL